MTKYSQQKITIKIPKGYTFKQRQAIGKDMLMLIKDRTFAGLDKNGDEMPDYNEDYAADKGVAPEDVNLVKSGRMLQYLRVLEVGEDFIDIGYGPNSQFNGQVEGNRLGSYGGDPNPFKARDFLGISARELKDILLNYPRNIFEAANGKFEIKFGVSKDRIKKLMEKRFGKG